MIEVLDHGFVRLIECWGHGCTDDTDFEVGIIEAARQSTQGAFRGWEKDYRLLKYLYDNKHSTPFEFAGMVIEVRAPLFVFREWHRHRTQSYNEMSARYSQLPPLWYLPTVDRLMLDGGKNKQADTIDGAIDLTAEGAENYIERLDKDCSHFSEQYSQDLRLGVPKEIARLGMPVGWYSQMRAQANLRNWLGFLTLRMDPAAQWEIRQFANAVGEIIGAKFPRTWRLFCD